MPLEARSYASNQLCRSSLLYIQFSRDNTEGRLIGLLCIYFWNCFCQIMEICVHTYIQHTTHLVTSELTMKAIERVCHGSQQKANITTTVTNIFMTWKDYEQMWIVNSSDEERRESRCSRNAILHHSTRRYHICKFISLSIYPIWLCCMRESGKKTLSPLFTDHKSKDDTARGRRR